MKTNIKILLDSNPVYKEYIRTNSYWYKILNRYPEQFTKFEEEVKEKYQLRATDRISKALDTFEMVTSILSTLKN